VLVANQDLLPGTELFRDPVLLEWSLNEVGAGDSEIPYSKLMEPHEAFTRMSAEKQEQYLVLHTRNVSFLAERCKRNFCSIRCNNGCQVCDIEPMLKFITIMRHRCFAPPQSNRRMVFATASMLFHSCAPNCQLDIQKDRCICRVISPVCKGEKLTAPHSEEILCDSTANRRDHWLKHYDYTCNCPRCDAQGDDTRQFHCFDATCTGQHWVRQPRLCDPPAPDMYYDGVEYEEPHLLPCTVCQRSPPLEYQARMFDYERRVKEKLTVFSKNTQHSQQYGSTPQEDVVNLVAPLNSMRFPLQMHSHGLELAFNEFFLLRMPAFGVVRVVNNNERLLQLAEVMEASFDRTLLNPSYTKYMHSATAAEAFLAVGKPQRALELARRLLRAHRIREGRTNPTFPVEAGRIEAVLDSALAACSYHVLAVTPEGCCVYCEESPERAAMKRSRCGACKRVIYCGAACQKAHWKAHKGQCRP
jgi:hypothetical protein